MIVDHVGNDLEDGRSLGMERQPRFGIDVEDLGCAPLRGMVVSVEFGERLPYFIGPLARPVELLVRRLLIPFAIDHPGIALLLLCEFVVKISRMAFID
uniref:hypothetical protein n=1 Tax=Halalkalicoccus ordinarius TaxID=3116651 RepID=UPI003908370A